MAKVSLPNKYFPDPDRGRPLFNASIYVGLPGTDPEVAINQVPVSLVQGDGTSVSVPQPIKTGAGGVPMYTGSPATIEVANSISNYSIKVLDSSGAQVYYSASADQSIGGGDLANAVGAECLYSDTGAANAYVLTPAFGVGPSEYFDGLTVCANFQNANTGASTVDVAGLGVKSIVGVGGVALSNGSIFGVTSIKYDSVADNFKLVKPLSWTPSNSPTIVDGGFNVWPEGTSIAVGIAGKYTANNFKCDAGVSTGAATVSRQAFTLGQSDVPNNPRYFCRIDQTSASNGGHTILASKIEDVSRHAGETIKFNFYAKVASGTKSIKVALTQSFGTGGSPSAAVEAVANESPVTITSAWQKFTVTFDVPSISGKTIGTDGNDSFQVSIDEVTGLGTFTLDTANWWIGEGDFPQQSMQEIVAECARYYQKSYRAGDVPATAGAFVGAYQQEVQASANLNHDSSVQFSNEMRAVPVVTVYSPSSGSAGQVHFSVGGDKGAIINSVSEKAITVSLSATYAGAVGEVWRYQWVADARL